MRSIVTSRPKAQLRATSSGIWSWLSPHAITGIAQIAAIYVGLLVFSFLLEFLQTYFMQWTGQKVMFDLRRQIFRHLQRLHVAFFDKNPVGRLVTRVTTDVDALNEMFTSGVVSIFEDLFVLFGILGVMLCMNWKLALITFAVLPFIVCCHQDFPRPGARFLPPHSRRHRPDQFVSAGARQRHGGAAALQSRAQGLRPILGNQPQPHGRVQRRDHGLLGVLPRGRNSFGHRDRLRDLVRRRRRDAQHSRDQRRREFQLEDADRVPPGAGTVASLGVLVAFIQYALRFFRPIMDFSEKYNILQSAMAASERIFKLLDTPVQVVSPAVTKRPEGPGRIEFDHVWFAYRDIDPGEDNVKKASHEGKETHVETGAPGRLAEQSSASFRSPRATRQPQPSPRLGAPRRKLCHRTR